MNYDCGHVEFKDHVWNSRHHKQLCETLIKPWTQSKLEAPSALMAVLQPNRPSANVIARLCWGKRDLRYFGADTRLRSPGWKTAQPDECLISLRSGRRGTLVNTEFFVAWVHSSMYGINWASSHRMFSLRLIRLVIFTLAGIINLRFTYMYFFLANFNNFHKAWNKNGFLHWLWLGHCQLWTDSQLKQINK